MKVTRARRKLLDALIENGGTIMGSQLSGVSFINAMRMQDSGWVIWERPHGSVDRGDMSTWKLHITAAGREID